MIKSRLNYGLSNCIYKNALLLFTTMSYLTCIKCYYLYVITYACAKTVRHFEIEAEKTHFCLISLKRSEVD